jgi:phosphoglucomutase
LNKINSFNQKINLTAVKAKGSFVSFKNLYLRFKFKASFMDAAIMAKVNSWLSGNYDEETRGIITRLLKDDPEELTEGFYKNLEFGTGGLRGIMGVGTNRINKYTIGMATQGYSNYLLKSFPNQMIKVAVAHDSRNNSRFFAETAAKVFAANGIKVFLFQSLRPTPELSFTIRYLGCQGGVVCTASHNPKEYNGYKAYWNDGGQLVAPHDKNVIAEVEKIGSIDEVKWTGGEAHITMIGKEIDEAYISMVKELSVNPEIIERQHNLCIVYTPIHGTGIKLIPDTLQRFGFSNVHVVDEQATPDGNFPTVTFPNPEEKETMSLGLKKAREINADILLGTDPDADRVGVGVRNDQSEWVLLNGNQTAVLAFNYLIEARKEKGIAQPNDMVVKTIVTTDMIDEIAKQSHIRCYNVLTGFKWIAELIREKEKTENYVIGGEESYGLMIGSRLRDKDAVSAVAILCEMAAFEKNKGNTLYGKLIDLYLRFGFYKESLISITKKGMDGQKQIADMMMGYRKNPPAAINGSAVVRILDYDTRRATNLKTGESRTIELPVSNVLQFILEDGSKISARPSGTEPKIKFYFSVKDQLKDRSEFHRMDGLLQKRIDSIIDDMKLRQVH